MSGEDVKWLVEFWMVMDRKKKKIEVYMTGMTHGRRMGVRA